MRLYAASLVLADLLRPRTRHGIPLTSGHMRFPTPAFSAHILACPFQYLFKHAILFPTFFPSLIYMSKEVNKRRTIADLGHCNS